MKIKCGSLHAYTDYMSLIEYKNYVSNDSYMGSYESKSRTVCTVALKIISQKYPSNTSPEGFAGK
jgi:hypothetical protein